MSRLQIINIFETDFCCIVDLPSGLNRLYGEAEIAGSIAGQICRFVDPKSISPGSSRKVKPQAYEAYLRANFFRDKNSPPDLERSIGFYTQAIALDEGYAQAYGNLSRCYFFCGVFGMGHPRDIFSKARASAA